MAVQLRPDIQQAADRLTTKAGSGREIKKLEGYLWEGEQVSYMVSGSYVGGFGLLVMTDRRLLFVRDGWASQTSESFALDQVTSVQWSAGMLSGAITIYSAGARADVSQVPKQDGKLLVDAVNNLLTRPASPAPAPSRLRAAEPPARQAPAGSAFDALRLLRDQRVITPEEFGQLVNRL